MHWSSCVCHACLQAAGTMVSCSAFAQVTLREMELRGKGPCTALSADCGADAKATDVRIKVSHGASHALVASTSGTIHASKCVIHGPSDDAAGTAVKAEDPIRYVDLARSDMPPSSVHLVRRQASKQALWRMFEGIRPCSKILLKSLSCMGGQDEGWMPCAGSPV